MNETRKIPTHEVTYVRLRDMILFGTLAPGQPVTIQGLVTDLSAGMTPVREAIRRLAAEGALLPQGNRRVTVPRLDPGLLDQIAFARQTLEPHVAELAARKASAALIATLEAHDTRVDAAIKAGDVPGYLESNHAFHFALYEASGAAVLTDMAQSLWLRFGPSLRFVIERGGALGLPDRHEEMLSAMRTGDPQGVARAMLADISQGVEQVRAALAKGEI